MNYIIAASPDKLSISMFIKLMIRNIGGYELGELHSFMTEESIKNYIGDFSKRYPRGLLSYYANRKVNIDPKICIPAGVQEFADILVWFDLYSLEVKVIKDKDDVFSKTFLDKWNKFVEKLNVEV